jgi:hypothetical protein
MHGLRCGSAQLYASTAVLGIARLRLALVGARRCFAPVGESHDGHSP